MIRVKDQGEFYVHQGERSERERVAIGKASRDARDRHASCLEQVSTRRTRGGGDRDTADKMFADDFCDTLWFDQCKVMNPVLDTPHQAWPDDALHRARGASRSELRIDGDWDAAD